MWVSLSKTNEPGLLTRIEKLSDENGAEIEYWPGVIYSRGKVAPDIDKVKFTIRLVVINAEVTLRRTGMLPWKAYDPKIPDSLFERVIKGIY